jgi:hypothetical protein
MLKGSDSFKSSFFPAGEYISSSVTVRPTAFNKCGQALSAFEVTPPPQAFGSFSGRPSKSATRAPPRAHLSAANDPAGPAPTIRTSNLSPITILL